MKYLLFTLIAIVHIPACAQHPDLQADKSVPVPKVSLDAQGRPVVKASPTSSSHDFDFLIGKWTLRHRRLKSRLTNSNDWEEFETVLEDFPILEGLGNMDVARVVMDGKNQEARTLRFFNTTTSLWSLYWMTAEGGKIGPPVTGSFEQGVGHFFGNDVCNGKNVLVVYRWDARDKEHSKWSQAFSTDNGKTWEWNWYNVKERIKTETRKQIAARTFAIPIPALKFDAQGELVITPSATSSEHDFDYVVGKWTLLHRKLRSRLEHDTVWTEFDTPLEDYAILDGKGNMDFAYGTIDGKPWEGRTIRTFDPKTRLWRLYWIASNMSVMDPPVVGSFENGIGHFFCKDVFKGKNIIMMFRWDARDKEYPIWSQAFSADNGKTWEWNWMNVSVRRK
jgi:hypothetical protein